MIVCTTGTTRNPIGKPLRRNALLAVGFGGVYVQRNGRVVFDAERAPRKHRGGDGFCRLRHVERLARRIGGEWTIEFNAPLWSAVYKRTARSTWRVISAGEGFA